MNDPYKVLGVGPNASDDEVKSAYRELVKKYHPDRYRENPLSDLAEEKMKEINEAYDTITKQRSGGSQNSRGYSGGANQYGNTPGYGGNAGYAGGSVFARVRQYIASGNIAQAEQLLEGVPERGAEWYFLMGSVCYRKGWYDEARRNFETACSMDPVNREYRQALTMINSGGVYRGPGYGSNIGGMNSCDCCTNLICADCCCEMMGGDLIPCC